MRYFNMRTAGVPAMTQATDEQEAAVKKFTLLEVVHEIELSDEEVDKLADLSVGMELALDDEGMPQPISVTRVA